MVIVVLNPKEPNVNIVHVQIDYIMNDFEQYWLNLNLKKKIINFFRKLTSEKLDITKYTQYKHHHFFHLRYPEEKNQ